MSTPPPSPNMTPLPSFSLARSKLHSAVGTGSRDNCSLHRWVLLKNSITLSAPQTTPASPSTIIASAVLPPSTSTLASISTLQPPPQYEDDDDSFSDEDAFLFPVAVDVVDEAQSPRSVSEDEWLDSLLESLADDDDDDPVAGVEVYRVTDEDEDDFSGLGFSPLNSSDDLTDTEPTAFPPYPPPIYPPFHPPLLRSFLGEDEDRFWYRQYRDPLPYLAHEDGQDDVDRTADGMSIVSPVPEAISDTSDDDSDAPSSPYIDTPASSYLLPHLRPSPMSVLVHETVVNVVDPATIPLPLDEHERARPRPQQAYFDFADTYFYPFELDPPQTDAQSQSASHLLHHLYHPYHQDC